MAEENKGISSECCNGCIVWEKFGNKCWVHWEKKKECSQFAGSWDEVPLR